MSGARHIEAGDRERSGRVVCRESVPLAALRISDTLAQECRSELDPRKVAYLARSINQGMAEVTPVLVKAHKEKQGTWYEVLHKPGQVAALSQLRQSECPALVLYGHDDFRLTDAPPATLMALAEKGTRIEREEDINVADLLLEGAITDDKHKDKLEMEMGKG
ncbi:hypothetical protein A2363_04210 [Candidatus Gottesmanbacteria bacterium RIFOXYB1_FULL_47_11]|uniref:Uncharacterized protein n=1 Tax=Candidatus Gottesmanbacteria bacterium RIFOXYB1_FULL_47_11 TaxID=1798401 RepID=A0A1F6BFV9_9BACT|nr:MAG: hypothetical protein A2363_04210 [Candidatus Gottesmanbacteria bacterium RIFOXYB1_FULL_47_11]